MSTTFGIAKVLQSVRPQGGPRRHQAHNVGRWLKFLRFVSSIVTWARDDQKSMSTVALREKRLPASRSTASGSVARRCKDVEDGDGASKTSVKRRKQESNRAIEGDGLQAACAGLCCRGVPAMNCVLSSCARVIP